MSTSTTATNRFDPASAFEAMARMRRFEEVQMRLWELGLVPGELHTGIGEEGIVAGVLAHLTCDDALALDHRATTALVGRGVDLEALFLEVMGSEEGLNRGRGGHMHLFAQAAKAASDGMVGSSGPLACGLALAGGRAGGIAVAFFGEGAVNEGMLLESWNLAVVWNLPVVFVCKDNGWSITTRSAEMTGGTVAGRARGFGLHTAEVDGSDVGAVYAAAGQLIARAREGRGPGLLLASCYRPQGHFMTDRLVAMLRAPVDQQVTPAGDPRALAVLGNRMRAFAAHHTTERVDPVAGIRELVDGQTANEIEAWVRAEVEQAARQALARVGASVGWLGGEE